METGWIKLYRCSIGSRVFNNEGLLKVWIWCLLRANHSTQWVNLKTGKGSIEVECKEGQFIYGRNSAALELKMSPETVRTRMNKLKNIENITIESTKQYSIITIMNWSTYQTKEIKDTSQNTKQTPSKHQANTTNKNDKNENNDKKKTKTFLLDSIEYQLAELLFTEILKSNEDHKKPNLQTWSLQVDLMIRVDNRTPDKIKEVILWCQRDSFWQSNILSTKKLRAQYDQLLINMKGKQKGGSSSGKYTGLDEKDYSEGIAEDGTF